MESEIKEIQIIADTNDYLVVNKPAGLLTHQTRAGEPLSLASWLLERYPALKEIGESPDRPGMVHRLDKEASGVLVVAKSQVMFDYLKRQFQNREVEKKYLVLVHGKVRSDHGMIDFAIGRGEAGRMAARPKTDLLKIKNVGKNQPGRAAVTEFLVEKRFARFTLLRVTIHTGRTHQIRVHLLAYGHPVVGDTLYFNKKLNRKRDLELGRLFLQAEKVCFKNLMEERVCYESQLPKELEVFLGQLK